MLKIKLKTCKYKFSKKDQQYINMVIILIKENKLIIHTYFFQANMQFYYQMKLKI